MAIERQANTTAAEVFARIRSRVQETTWQAFYQTLVENRAARDVAHELGISVASVYKNTYRVKQMLQEEYGNVDAHQSGAVVSGRDDPAAVSS